MARRRLGRKQRPVDSASDRAATGQRPRLRAGAGYFTGDLARAAVEDGCDFAAAAKRNTATWRANAGVDAEAWVEAIGMTGTQVAAVDYAPAVGRVA